jgi:hypothetical protein
MNSEKDFIEIGKYSIGKTVLMSCPPQFSFFNNETKTKSNLDHGKILAILRNENLDCTPFLDFLETISL